MYIEQLINYSWIYLILYVDDILITGIILVETGELKGSLDDKFAMKALTQA